MCRDPAKRRARRRDTRTRKASAGGFTLLEILVALSLLGVVMTLVLGGLRLGARAWQAGDEESARTERFRTTFRLLRGLTDHMVPAQVIEEEEWRYVFRGGAQALRMVAPAPSGAGKPAPYLIWVEVRDTRGDADLTLSWRPFDGPADNLRQPREEERIVLVTGSRSIEFAYLPARIVDGAPDWVSDWDDEDDLPALVRVRVENESSEWPDLILPIRVEAEHECVFRSTARRKCRVLRYD